MINIPARDDKKYMDIEDFHDFEFTECVAWEMAIRNHNVKTLLLKLNEIRKEILENYFYSTSDGRINTCNLHSDDIGQSVDILDHLNDDNFYLEEKKQIALWEQNGQLNEAVGHYNIADILDLKNVLNDFENKFKAITHDETRITRTKIFLFSHKELTELIDLADSFFINYETLKNEYFILFEDYISIDEQMKKTIANTEKISWKIDNHKWRPYKITTKQNLEIDTKLFCRRSRPILRTPLEISNILTLDINLNLPLKEISKYIGQLQQAYKRDMKLILPRDVKSKGKNRMLLNTPQDEISYGKNEKVTLAKVFSNKVKIATAFYVYDSVNINVGIADISTEVAVYRKKNSDIKTLKEYYEVMKYYIDSQHYKELMTGYALP